MWSSRWSNRLLAGKGAEVVELQRSSLQLDGLLHVAVPDLPKELKLDGGSMLAQQAFSDLGHGLSSRGPPVDAYELVSSLQVSANNCLMAGATLR
mmetsp:Transcript_61786/g.165936  ORF Transcript_61786/g.165936 Transcript_61786/m.165936 type:complete len:95 (-) Transcript_61786:155-439(-)